MSVIIFAEATAGEVKKSSLEAISYGKILADKMNTSAEVIVASQANNLASLGQYGAQKAHHFANPLPEGTDISVMAANIAAVYENAGGTVLVMSKSSLVDALSGRLAVRLQADCAVNVVEAPEAAGNQLTVRRSIYTGKAFAQTTMTAAHKILVIKKNACETLSGGADAQPVSHTADTGAGKVKHFETQRASGGVPLPEAEIVVSAGRGMKGPENWGIIEELAATLGAATACSKPVSDVDWRPHHEHVGQTGVKVSPNLYIAVGISGAIQHLAGVNSSKVIVVINKDSEAPFFKAADYGVVGDLFDVVPKLTQALKNA